MLDIYYTKVLLWTKKFSHCVDKHLHKRYAAGHSLAQDKSFCQVCVDSTKSVA